MAATHESHAARASEEPMPFPSKSSNGDEYRRRSEGSVPKRRADEDPTSTSKVTESIPSGTAPPEEICGRERLKRHRVEISGRVWIPDIWGQEDLLNEWIDCAAFHDASMMSIGRAARASLAEEGRRRSSMSPANRNPARLVRIQNGSS